MWGPHFNQPNSNQPVKTPVKIQQPIQNLTTSKKKPIRKSSEHKEINGVNISNGNQADNRQRLFSVENLENFSKDRSKATKGKEREKKEEKDKEKDKEKESLSTYVTQDLLILFDSLAKKVDEQILQKNFEDFPLIEMENFGIEKNNKILRDNGKERCREKNTSRCVQK